MHVCARQAITSQKMVQIQRGVLRDTPCYLETRSITHDKRVSTYYTMIEQDVLGYIRCIMYNDQLSILMIQTKVQHQKSEGGKKIKIS
jgi:hypothetical protein